MDKRVTISLSQQLYNKLRSRSELNKRSLKAQIEWELEKANNQKNDGL